MRLTGISTSNAIEASLDSVWGEDLRYFREPEKSFVGAWERGKADVYGAAPRGTIRACLCAIQRGDGQQFSFQSWRVKDEADTSHALERIGEGFAGRMASNAWEEFWPNVTSRVFHHGH